MRSVGMRYVDRAPGLADTTYTVALTTTAQALDWPTGAELALIACQSGAYLNWFVATVSAGSGLATAGSSRSEFIPANTSMWRQITGDSTGFSVLGTTANGGAFTMSFYSK